MEQLDFHMHFLKTENYFLIFFFIRKCCKNSLLMFLSRQSLTFWNLPARELQISFCLSSSNFSSPRAATDINYFFQNFKIRCKELCPIFIRAEANFLPRKANDPSELLLPSNTKTASLMRLQVLITENLSLIASCSILQLHIINKVLGDRHFKKERDNWSLPS